MSGNIIHELASGLPTDVPVSSGIPAVQSRAQNEIDRWGTMSESSEDARPILSEYWTTVGLGPGDWSPTGTPWSAAFVSHLMKPYGLPPEAAHWKYTKAVVDGLPGWKAYAISGPVPVAPGDIVVRPRGSSSSPADEGYYFSHGDVIYAASDEKVSWIGGNISNRLKTGDYPVDADGLTDFEGDYVLLLRPPSAGLVGAAKKNLIPILAIGAALGLLFVIQRQIK